jgi:hypothetical protein
MRQSESVPESRTLGVALALRGRDDVARELPGGGPTNELEELVWLSIEEARETEVPTITRTVLGDLRDRLEADPDLRPGGLVPFYYLRHNRFRRDLI